MFSEIFVRDHCAHGITAREHRQIAKTRQDRDSRDGRRNPSDRPSSPIRAGSGQRAGGSATSTLGPGRIIEPGLPFAGPIGPLRSLTPDFPFVARDRSEDRDGTAGLKRFRADRRFLNDLLRRVVGVVRADVLMEDRDDPSPLADLENNGRVVRILVMPRNPTPFRDPTFALEHGVAELEDIARQCLLERRNRPPPDVISARVERITLRAGVSQGLDRQAYALTVGDLLADSFAGKLQHFLIQWWDRHRRRRRARPTATTAATQASTTNCRDRDRRSMSTRSVEQRIMVPMTHAP